MSINTHVDGLGQFLPRIQLYIFPDSIEHNDRIVDRITNDKEYCRENGNGKFHIQYGNCADDNNDIMNKSNYTTQSIAEFKTPGYINEHGQPGKNYGKNGFSLEIHTYLGTDNFHSSDFVIFIESRSQWFIHVFFKKFLIMERFRSTNEKLIGAELLNDAVFQTG